MIDLQLHTTDSDGTWGWREVLTGCQALKLKAYAVTDHDTIIRQAEIKAWARENDENAIAGIEMSTREKGQTVHLLGYFLEGPLRKLEEKLRELRCARQDRNKKIIAKLNQLGMKVTEEDVHRLAGEGTVGRPHIARCLMGKGYVRSIKEAFEKYLSAHGAAYYPKEELPLREAIELLRASGAVTSVAHPGLLNRSRQELESSLKDWKAWGLDGIEGIYPAYSKEQIAFFSRMAGKYQFLMTGGSDFHGEVKPQIQIGVGTGHLNVPDELLEPLLKKRDENRALFQREAESSS